MPKPKQYRALTGLDYPVGDEMKRAEIGDEVDDLPASGVKWLLRDGLIEEVES